VARGLFVTGTDTGVGKTVVSAALMHHLRRHAPAIYWKPIQTGIEQDDDTACVRDLGRCSDEEIRTDGVRLPRPVSPHLAAELSKVRIDLGAFELRASVDSARWVVEGAGGVLVPINESASMVDLMARLALPVVVVARSGLGTINHTLLTVEALRGRHVAIAGIVMVGEPNRPNRDAIETYGRVRVLGELPPLPMVTPATIGAWALSELDCEGVLVEATQ
jgi:dethiobiotin synthetase